MAISINVLGLKDYDSFKKTFEQAEALLENFRQNKLELFDILDKLDSSPEATKLLELELGERYTSAHDQLTRLRYGNDKVTDGYQEFMNERVNVMTTAVVSGDYRESRVSHQLEGILNRETDTKIYLKDIQYKESGRMSESSPPYGSVSKDKIISVLLISEEKRND